MLRIVYQLKHYLNSDVLNTLSEDDLSTRDTLNGTTLVDGSFLAGLMVSETYIVCLSSRAWLFQQ